MAMRTFWRDRRGSVALLTAFAMMLVVSCAALAVDLGSVFLATRKLQGIADLAALAGANNLSASTSAAAAQATANDNGWSGPITVAVTTGQYQNASSIPVGSRFQSGGTSPNAVRVTLTANTGLFFIPILTGRSQWTITRTATAAQADMASFSIGSRVLSVQNGAANAILAALTGSQVSLSAGDYTALAQANIDLLSYAQALQTNAGLQGLAFGSVLNTNISTGSALTLLASQLGSDPAAQSAAKALATAAGTSSTINLSQLLDLGPYAQQDHALNVPGATIDIDALDLANAILMLGGNGHEVQLNLGGLVPGVSQVTAYLAIGQRPSNSPWLTVDDQGQSIIYTTQARLYLNVQAVSSGLLSALGVSVLNVPILVDVASAEAKLSSMNCSGPAASQSATLLAAPSLGQVAIASINPAQLTNFTQPLSEQPAILVSLPLLTLTGRAVVNLGGQDWQTVSFSQSDVQAQTVKTVYTDNITQSIASSLVGGLTLNVQLAGLGLGIGSGPVTAAAQSILSSVAPNLDSLINGLTAALGVGLGEADLRMTGLRCGQPALVA